MKTKTTAVRLLGVAMIAAAVTPWLGGGSASAITKAAADISVKGEQVPTTAAAFPNKQTDCPGFVAGAPFDVWHFVLDGNDHVFVELTAEFTGGITVTVFPNSKHAYVKATAGLQLVDAYANVEPNAGIPSDFQLSHVCVGTPTTTTTSSAPVTTSSSAPVTTSSSAPASVLPTKASTTPEDETSVEGTKAGRAPNVLPKTGSGMSLGTGLAISFGLLLGGAALLFVPRRLALEKGQHRRH